MTRFSTADVIQLGADYGVPRTAFLCSDEFYVMPDFGWVFDTMMPAFTQLKEVIGVSDYISLANDCDDYARLCAAYAQILNARTLRTVTSEDSGLAFGEFWYMAAGIGCHAINVFLSRVDSGVRLVFVEPQTGQQLHLTDNEIRSCVLFRL